MSLSRRELLKDMALAASGVYAASSDKAAAVVGAGFGAVISLKSGRKGAQILTDALSGALVFSSASRLVGCTPAPSDGTPRSITASPATIKDPYAENTPSYPPTPQAGEFRVSGLVVIYNNYLNEQTRTLLTSLDILIQDPIVRYYTADGIISNALASQPGGPINRAQILRDQGRKFFTNLCGDSRVVCSDLFAVVDGETFTAIEGRSLGAQPKIAEKGTKVTVLATHCNSVELISIPFVNRSKYMQAQ